jgi:hypothetical protein
MFPIPSPTRLALYAAAGLVVALAAIWALWSFDPFNRRQRAEMKAANAIEQTRVTGVVAKASETHHTQTIVIKERESRAIETVQNAPGADDLLPPDLRAALIDGLRDITAGPGDDNRPDKP